MPKLVITTADGAEIVHELDGDVVVGRHASADIQVGDAKVSRKHCRFYQTLGAWSVEDLGSSNGVRLNGVRGAKSALRAGDRIEIGGTVIVFEVPAPKAFKAPVSKSDRKRRERQGGF